MEKGNDYVPFLIMLPLNIYFASHILKFEPHPHPDPHKRRISMMIQQESMPLPHDPTPQFEPQPVPNTPFEPQPPQRSNKRIIQQQLSLPPNKLPMHNTPYHFYISNLMRCLKK